MIALGLTDADVTVPAGFYRTFCNGLQVLGVPQAPTPRDRLAAGVDLARDMDRFLPFAPRPTLNFEVALAWANDHKEEAKEALARVSGRAQLTIDLAPNSEPARSLRARAKAHRDLRMARKAITDVLAPAAVRTTRSGRRIHLLLARDGAADWPRQIAQAGLSGWKAVASGPWPPFAFAIGVK